MTNPQDITFGDAPKAADTLPSPGEHYGVIAEMIAEGPLCGRKTEEYQGKRREVFKLAFPIQVEEMLEPPEGSDYEPRRKTIWLWTNLAFGDRAKFPKIYQKIMGKEPTPGDKPYDLVGQTVRIDVVKTATGAKVDHIVGVNRPGLELVDYKSYSDIQKEKAAREEPVVISDEDRAAMADDDDIPF